jgi:hypothetical protein
MIVLGIDPSNTRHAWAALAVAIAERERLS